MNRQLFKLKNLSIIYDCFSKKESLDYLEREKIPFIYFSPKENDQDNTPLLLSCFPKCFFPISMIMDIPYIQKNTFYTNFFGKLDKQLNFNNNPSLMLKFLDNYVNNGLEQKDKNTKIETELQLLWDNKTPEEQTKLIFVLKYCIGYQKSSQQQLFQTLLKQWNIDKTKFLQTQEKLIELALFINNIAHFPNNLKNTYFQTMSMAYINGYKKIFNLLYSCVDEIIFENNMEKAPHNFAPQLLDNMLDFFKWKMKNEENLKVSPFFPDNNSSETLREVMEEVQPLFSDENYLEGLSKNLIREYWDVGDSPILNSYWQKYWFLIFLDFFQMYMQKNPQKNDYWIWKKAIFTYTDVDFSFLETWGAWNQLQLIKSFELDWLDFYLYKEGSRESFFHSIPIHETDRQELIQALWMNNDEDLEKFFYTKFAWRFPAMYLEKLWHLRSIYGEDFIHKVPYVKYYEMWIKELLDQDKKTCLNGHSTPHKTSILIDIEKTFFNKDNIWNFSVQDIIMSSIQRKEMVAKSYITRSFLWQLINTISLKGEFELIIKNYNKTKLFSQANKINIWKPQKYALTNFIQKYQNKVCFELDKLYHQSMKKVQKDLYSQFSHLFPLKKGERALFIADSDIISQRDFSWLYLFWKEWGVISSNIGIKTKKTKFILVNTKNLYKLDPDEYKYIFAFSNMPTVDWVCKLDYQKRLLHCTNHYFPWKEIILIQWNQPKRETITLEEANNVFSISTGKHLIDTKTFQKKYPFYKYCFFELNGTINLYHLSFDVFWESDIFWEYMKKWYQQALLEENFLKTIIAEVYLSWLLKDNRDLVEQAMGIIDHNTEKLISNISILSDHQLFPYDDPPLYYHSCIEDIYTDPNLLFSDVVVKIIESLNNLAQKQIKDILDFIEQLIPLSEEFE